MIKTIAFLLLILTINACKGQDDKGIVTYPKNKEMNNTELFDVKGFKNYQTEQKKQGKNECFGENSG
ncbi:hypothetical protein [Chryseobacterium taklimakanense]|uniref:hypothetical protein n=1 Tax=Chryseobacterium taklimakanense TaxID=536441 RepID=UPI0023F756C0|nr:hypothetical protein [Chryseobacterium taklimakanense]